jgi:proteasome lid subunit RPN8/RPN11
VSSTQSSSGGVFAPWNAELLATLYELVFSAPDRELAGVLVGVAAGDEQPLPVIRAVIPASEGFAVGHAAIFDNQIWARIHADMTRYYTGLDVVGWYVSRPGCGTGLSEAEALNHGRWFARPDQILLVVDSQTHRAAIHAWVQGRLVSVAEGAVTRPVGVRRRKSKFPLAALSLLIIVGGMLGVGAFLIKWAL